MWPRTRSRACGSATALDDGAALDRLVPASRPRLSPLHLRGGRGPARRAVREDARDILPESMIFQYREIPELCGLLELFPVQAAARPRRLVGRYRPRLPATVRLRRALRLRLRADARRPRGTSSGVIKAPAGSEPWPTPGTPAGTDPKDPWGETGPRLVAETIARFGSNATGTRPDLLPGPLPRLATPDRPRRAWHFDESTRAVHLWNEMWRRDGSDKDQDYPPGCLYEQLKRMYLGPHESPVRPGEGQYIII